MPIIDLSPAWSPDGARIAFYHYGVVEIDYEAEQYEVDPDSAGVWLTKADGSDGQLLLRGARHPRWSPDNQWLVLVYQGSQIWKIRPDGSGLTLLASEGKNFFPTWSPDEDSIAFDSSAGSTGGYAIWVMKTDGSDKKLLVPGRNADWDPALSGLLYIGRVLNDGVGIVRYDLEEEQVRFFLMPGLQLILWVP